VTDGLIDAAQSLLSHQFPQVDSLQSVCLLEARIICYASFSAVLYVCSVWEQRYKYSVSSGSSGSSTSSGSASDICGTDLLTASASF
jgi:hypothetical protein